MTTGVLHIPLTAFSAYGSSLGVSAHNLANVLTPNFKPGRVTYAELPAQSGVAASISQPVSEKPTLTPGPGWGHREAVSRPSETDVAREMVNLITTSHAYKANAKLVSTADSMLGTVVDMAV